VSVLCGHIGATNALILTKEVASTAGGHRRIRIFDLYSGDYLRILSPMRRLFLHLDYL
jgi:hypothetical protein